MYSATSPPQKYVHEMPATLSPQSVYVGNDGFVRNYATAAATLPSMKKNRTASVSMQTIVLAFTVLLCLSSCILSVTLQYKWRMETHAMIGRLEGSMGELARDVNAFTDSMKDEISARRVSSRTPPRHPEPPRDDNNYEDLENDYDANRFMDKDLSDNKRPSLRDRRNAEIDSAIQVKNELHGPTIEKSNVELIEVNNNSTEENTVKTYNRRKPKKMGIIKKKTAAVMEGAMEELEDLKEDAAAAHFSSDSSRYNTKLHPNYNGNGLLRHPDGDFRDWTYSLWDPNLNNENHILMKSGKVEILTPGLYFVYAQIYYSDQHDINGYYIMKNDVKVLGCTSTRHRETQSDSCYTGGLIYFNSNDSLSIRGLDTERYVILDKIKTFFGLFKVTKDSQR